MNLLEQLKEKNLLSEVEEIVHKCQFIADPGELIIVKDNKDHEYIMMYLRLGPHDAFSRNNHYVVNLSGIMGGGCYINDFWLAYSGSNAILKISDNDLRNYSVEKRGRTSAELLNFFFQKLN